MADLLRLPGFRAFWLANLISNLGTSAFVLAINWLTVKQHGPAGIATLALAYGLPQMLLQLVHWASLSVFLAGSCSYLAISTDNALLQAGTDRDMQGRINAIANLTKGLESLSLAAAGYTIHLISATHRFGSGYQAVQVSLAIALLAGVFWLWPRLHRLQLR